mmetsp:Transcript_2948/g.11261  ORF Transcript_2948/g.11261 Transcript_2948/m.11261 type:complete len:140 (-) Transcript_2948:85-504(-)
MRKIIILAVSVVCILLMNNPSSVGADFIQNKIRTTFRKVVENKAKQVLGPIGIDYNVVKGMVKINNFVKTKEGQEQIGNCSVEWKSRASFKWGVKYHCDCSLKKSGSVTKWKAKNYNSPTGACEHCVEELITEEATDGC